MTLYGEPEVWLEQFPLREPKPIECDHLGLRYTREVIRADRWSPSWGAPLEGDTFFRIILLRQRRSEFSPDIRDPRIAVCLPGAGLSRQHSRLTGELATTRETRAVYLSQRDTQADLIRRTLQRRQQELEEELLSEEAIRYSDGRILTGSTGSPAPDAENSPAPFFTGLDPAAWFCRIAGWLLARAYPTLPINQDALPRTVTKDDASSLHRAIFQQVGGSPAILEQLGPGLGLPLPGDPGAYDPSQSPVFGLIRERIASEPVPAKWPAIFGYLTRDVGLTGPLATLFLLLYLHRERPDLELRLSPSHRLTLVGGTPLPGTRLGGDLVPLLRWDDAFGDQDESAWAVSIGPVTEPDWNDALPHLSTLAPGLAPVSVGQELQPQEQTLIRRLDALAAELAQTQELIALLERAQELRGQMGYQIDTPVDTDADTPVASAQGGGALTASLGRLSQISGRDFRSIYQSVRSAYTDYRLLEEDLSLLHQISLLGRHKLAAVELLNSLPELGEPAGAGLHDSLSRLEEAPPSCTVSKAQLDLETAPWCSSCRLNLETRLPSAALSRLLPAIDGALEAKNGQLSIMLVERILHGQADGRLDDFLKIVQASDLSALATTLNQELLDFIRRLLA